jgi:hypothetical protein
MAALQEAVRIFVDKKHICRNRELTILADLSLSTNNEKPEEQRQRATFGSNCSKAEVAHPKIGSSRETAQA